MELFSSFQIGDNVSFRPMYRHQQQLGIADEPMWGKVVAIKFTPAKVFYDILDDYHSKVFDEVDSVKVWQEKSVMVEPVATN